MSSEEKPGMSFEDLKREALKYSAEEREELMETLAVSLEEEEEDTEHERLWTEEIERRCREIDEGRATLIPADEVLAKLRAKLK